jgi:hypothetical protein
MDAKERIVSGGRNPQPWSEQLIVQRYKNGDSLRSMVIDYGISRGRMSQMLKKAGVATRTGRKPLTGESGTTVHRASNKHPYILRYVPDHPNANQRGYVREHRLVMEKHLGRFLAKTEVVHHIDGNVQNNVIANLELLPNNGVHSRETLGYEWDDDLLKKWFDQGVRVKDIATLLERNSSGVAGRIRRSGLQRKRKKIGWQPITDDHRREAAQLPANCRGMIRKHGVRCSEALNHHGTEHEA